MKIETDANERVERYKNYAATLKLKFEEYEKESEQYYADLLEKFKA